MNTSRLVDRPAAPSETLDGTTAEHYGLTVNKQLALAQSIARLGFDWCWEQDEQFRFVVTSTPWLVGVPELPRDLVGKRPWEIEGAEIVGLPVAAFIDLHRKQQPYRDVLIRRKGRHGRTYSVLASATPILDDAGIFVGYRGGAREATHLMREREAIDRARNAADRDNAAKTRFLACMSHEIRTPLNGVLGMIDLLMKTDLSFEQRRFAETANAAGDSLVAIINDVLDYSKISEGKLELESRPFDLRIVVSDVIGLFSPRAREKPSVDLRSVIAEGTPAALDGDANRIRQILTNLVANAIRFTESGEIVVRVECAKKATGPKTGLVDMEISVADTGAGMSADAVSRLFQPYTQVGGDAAQRAGGSGLGLVIVKQLVCAMFGSIEVESTPSVGTRFSLRIPMRIADAGSLVVSRNRVPPKARRIRSGGLVLVVEDNPVNQVLVRAMLSRIGIACEIVADGEAGLAAFRSGRFDVILMDCEMPMLDGFETTRAIRAVERSRRARPTPIIALTANALQGDRKRALAAGMDDYLAKPYKSDQLGDMIARWIDSPRP
ncbi:MAG: ATP-binding protein [Burkholderiales bacterium]